eukprot:TRINITY_DN68863_c0_g1_i1.p1 TRINITY_DN68863_c0_g1~~TRINITY_DN68863_c0_g1_i1.p1  ORF type:complete len:423 (-),score=89.60 TRINITY_DN68863_c0_g1_i1:119-1354(-)
MASAAADPQSIDVVAELEEGVLKIGQAAGEFLGLAAEELPPEELPARKFMVPYVVRIGGAVLCVCAGITNTVSFLTLTVFTSHATGTLSKVGIGLQDNSRFSPESLTLLLLSFLAGSALCGVFIGKNKVHFGLALYDFGLLSVSCLLVLTFLTAEQPFAKYFAAAACGLQNGLCTEWGGATIRTTHVTGLLTDVGLLIGRMASMLARKRCGKSFDIIDSGLFADDRSKLAVLTILGCSFLLGSYLGALVFNAWQEKGFLLPAGVTGSLGLAYLFYRVLVLHNRLFSAEEMEIVDVPVGMVSEHAEEFSDVPRRERSRSKDMFESAGKTDQSHVLEHTCTRYHDNAVVGVARGEMLKFITSHTLGGDVIRRSTSKSSQASKDSQGSKTSKPSAEMAGSAGAASETPTLTAEI